MEIPEIKKTRKEELVILAFVVITLVAINYNLINNSIVSFMDESQEVHVDRIIDGDTFETTIDGQQTSVRLSGINSPEKKEFMYQEAKDFLSAKILGKNVTLKFTNEKTDKYGRTLAYVFLGEGNESPDVNVNVLMVKEGYANYYFYSGKDTYSSALISAWDGCVANGKNLCESSVDICSSCIKIGLEKVVNICNFSCSMANWTIETEGREIFPFGGTVDGISTGDNTMGFQLDLANSGGTVFLRDSQGKLVDWKVF